MKDSMFSASQPLAVRGGRGQMRTKKELEATNADEIGKKNNITFVYIRGIILCIFLADYLKHITSPLKRYSIFLVQKQAELQFYQY